MMRRLLFVFALLLTLAASASTVSAGGRCRGCGHGGYGYAPYGYAGYGSGGYGYFYRGAYGPYAPGYGYGYGYGGGYGGVGGVGLGYW